jgi:hypothetical protein
MVLERQIQEELEMLAEDPKNEAECRLQINPLFLDSLKRERRALAASPTPPPYLPSFTLETSLALEVVYKGRRMMLTGDMDYSMRYARDETAAGLVVFEAKKLATMGFGLAQCLTYMGMYAHYLLLAKLWLIRLSVMIHMIRKSENRENAVIWGVVSNGREWLFLRIDNDTKVRVISSSEYTILSLHAHIVTTSFVDGSRKESGAHKPRIIFTPYSV